MNISRSNPVRVQVNFDVGQLPATAPQRAQPTAGVQRAQAPATVTNELPKQQPPGEAGAGDLGGMVMQLLQAVLSLISSLFGMLGGGQGNGGNEAGEPGVSDGTVQGLDGSSGSEALSDGSSVGSSDGSSLSDGSSPVQQFPTSSDSSAFTSFGDSGGGGDRGGGSSGGGGSDGGGGGGGGDGGDPIVLDLNGNRRADITGSSIHYNGKLEGRTVNGFDLNPQDRQWSNRSATARPGRGAPALPPGTTMKVFDANGRQVSSKAVGPDARMPALSEGRRAEFWSQDGRLLSELRTEKGKPTYNWGNVNRNEWTKEWDKKAGGDGLLVWDVDGDNKITSGKELFGEFDTEGNMRFQNGYQKLAHYFDRDKDGFVRGDEVKGLKIWEDRNGDGVTQQGELVDLAKHGVTSFDVRSANKPAHDMRSSYTANGRTQDMWDVFFDRSTSPKT